MASEGLESAGALQQVGAAVQGTCSSATRVTSTGVQGRWRVAASREVRAAGACGRSRLLFHEFSCG